MKLDRRTFLMVSAATAATATLADYTPIMASLGEGTRESGETGVWISTVCQGCTSWCPMQAYVIDNRVVKVRGNPYCKATLGKICPRPHLALQQMYDPDRVKVPLKRTNPVKGRGVDPMFVPITWDEATEMIADKILDLHANEEAHKFALLRGRYTALNGILYGSLPKLLGSPNNISHSSICAEAEKFGSFYTEGYWNYNDFDLEHTRYLVSFGVDPLSMNRQVPRFINVWARLLDHGKVAVVDPRLSSTAAKADEWLPVIPGEDGAIAVAIAHVLLTEERWYKPFVGDFIDGVNRFATGEQVDESLFAEKHTHGLVKWWNLELFDKTPEWAAERAGIPAEQIIRVARNFAAAAPNAISWVSAGATMNPRGAYISLAVHALNGLVGSVDNVGGIFQHISIPSGRLPEMDPFMAIMTRAPTGRLPDIDPFMTEMTRAYSQYAKIDQRGTLLLPALNNGRSGGGVVTNRVADAILDEDPYDIKVMIGYWCNFVHSCSETQRWEKALEKVPFFVHLTTHPAEMSIYADLVLPATFHLFERHSPVIGKQNLHSYLAIQQRCVESPFDVKSDETEFVWLLAEKLAAKGFPNVLDWCQTFQDPVTGKTPTNGREFEDIATRTMTHPVWSGDNVSLGDNITSWEEYTVTGVWNTSRHPYRTRWDNFNTETKKFELYSETLKKALAGHADKHNTTIDEVLRLCNYTAQGELAFVPHYEPALRHGDASEYPLIFTEARSRFNREGRAANCTWYYEMKDADPGDERYADVAKINPITAREQGLKNGDTVKIISPVGEITCTIKVWEGVRPGLVNKTFGQGHWAYGSVAALEFNKTPRGANNNEILPADYDRLTGSTTRHGGVVRVKIEKTG